MPSAKDPSPTVGTLLCKSSAGSSTWLGAPAQAVSRTRR